MYGYIYKTIDLNNNKIYIGKHKSPVFEGYSYLGSGEIIKKIKQKCLKENISLQERFKIELLAEANNDKELNNLEIFFIKKFKSDNPSIGYNLTKGGDGGDTNSNKICVTDGSKNKLISLNCDIPKGFHKGSKSSKENHPCYNRKFKWYTNGVEDIQVETDDQVPPGFHLGRCPLTDNQKQKLSKNHNTYKDNFSEEFLLSLSNRWKGENNPNRINPKFGKDNPFYNKTHSKESRDKISKACSLKYKCPYCEYINIKSALTKHIKKNHIN